MMISGTPLKKVFIKQNALLEADITEKDVKGAIFGSYAEGAPGPDSFSFIFYQHFWNLVKKDLMLMAEA